MTDPSNAHDTDHPIARARRHHRTLYATSLDLESALAVAAGDLDRWLESLARVLESVRDALADQRLDYEGEDGVFVRVMAQAPRLAPEVDRIRAEHDQIGRQVAAALATVRKGSGGETAIVGPIRDECLEVFTTISRNRHDTADVLFRAYDVDLGGGD